MPRPKKSKKKSTRAASASRDARAAIVDADDGSRGDAGACATATSDANAMDIEIDDVTKKFDNAKMELCLVYRDSGLEVAILHDEIAAMAPPRPQWLLKAIRDRPPEVCPVIHTWLYGRSDYELGEWTNYNVTPNSSPTQPRPEALVKAMRDAQASLNALHSSRRDTYCLPAPLPDSFDGRTWHCFEDAWSPEAWSAEDLTNLMTQTAFFAQQSRTTRLQVAAGMTVHLTPEQVFKATSGWWLDMATRGNGAVIVSSWLSGQQVIMAWEQPAGQQVIMEWEGHPDVRWMEVILKFSYFRGIQRLERTRRDPAGLETTAQLFANTWAHLSSYLCAHLSSASQRYLPGEAPDRYKKPLNRIVGTLEDTECLVYRDSGLEVAILHDEIAAMVRNKQNSLAEFCLWLFPEEVCQHPSIHADDQHAFAYEYDYKDCRTRESYHATEMSCIPHEADPTPDFFLKYWGEWRDELWATNSKRFFEYYSERERHLRSFGLSSDSAYPPVQLRREGVSP